MSEPQRILTPISVTYLVGWKNEGNYLEDVTDLVRQYGICFDPKDTKDE